MAVVSWLSNDNEVTKNKIRDDNIAPIELNASSASKTYTVGKRFVLDSDGKLYKATQQINQGSAIITSGANANCEEVTEKVLDTLGTASTKNSTSVVTQSTDLVESGAVKDIVGWGNKNLSIPYNYTTTVSDFTITYENNKVVANGETGNTDVIYPVSSVARNNGYTFDLPAGTFTISLTGDTTNLEPQIVKASDGSVLMGTTITLDTPTTIFVRVMVKKNNTFNNQICYIQLEKGSTATAYEPYHASVEDSKCDNSVIGTVEDGTTASQAYAVGSHFIRNGAFCTCTQAIAQGGTFTLNTNYVVGALGNFIVKKYTKSVTVAAGGITDVTIPQITDYTIIGITPTGTGTGTWASFDPIVFYGAGYVSAVVVRNRDTNDAHTWDIYLYVIYAKTNTIVQETLT